MALKDSLSSAPHPNLQKITPAPLAHRRFGTEWLVSDAHDQKRVGGKLYQRSARFLVVRLAAGHTPTSLTNLLNAPDNGLQDCGIDTRIEHGFWLIRLSDTLCQRHVRDPDELQPLLQRLRMLPGVESVNPLLREAGTSLALVCSGEIVLRLRSDISPEAYFGAVLDQARRLRGTSDQWVLRIPGCRMEDVAEQCRLRSLDPRLVWVEPHFLEERIKQTTDPLYALQWHLQNSGVAGAKAGADVKAVSAWSLQKGTTNIVIAVLDDGVDLQHPDLKTRLFRNPGEIPNNGVDDDGNGYVDDVQGWDFFAWDGDPSPVASEDRHGTAVAGVAVAAANNGIGGAGLAYGCTLLPVRFASGDFTFGSDLVEAIYYAAGRSADGFGTWRGADIINISYGGRGSSALQDAVSYAARYGRGGLGAPIFASSGNSASKWSKLDLPVGEIFGAGTFRFGFRYIKDASDYGQAVEDLARIDDVALVASDYSTIRNSALGTQGRQDFESGPFPPQGWSVFGSRAALIPTVVSGGSFSGTGGKRSVQFSPRLDTQWSELMTPVVTLQGDEYLRFQYYISSEGSEALGYGFDGLIIRVYDSGGNLILPIDDPPGTGHPFLWGDSETVNGVEHPAAYPNVIAVGASTDADVRAPYSQFGPELDFLAPSSGGWHGIVTTDRVGAAGYSDTDYFHDFGGTSSASPLAAGVGALLLSANPGLGSEDLRQLLSQTCDRIGGQPYSNARNDEYGYGRLNAARALQRLNAVQFNVSSLPLAVPIRKDYSFSATVTNRGSAVLSSVMITNTLPEHAQLVSIGQSQGTFVQADGKIVFEVGPLAPGAGAGVEVVLNPTELGTMVHQYVVATNGSWGYSMTRTVEAELPRLRIQDTSVVEGNDGTTNAVFVLTLSAPLLVPLTVDFYASSGFFDKGSFVPTNGVVTFAPGSTNQILVVQVNGDQLDEDLDGFFVFIDAFGDIILAEDIGVCEIIDDDDPPSVSVVPASVAEGRRGARELLVELGLSAPSAKAVSVSWATRQGTALVGKDFQAATGTVHFAVGSQSETLSLQILGNRLVEADKQFFVDLFSPVACTLGNSNGVVTILNDDGLPGMLDHFGIITTSEPHYSNEPFPLQVLALDSQGEVVPQFAGPVSLRFAFPPIVVLSNNFEPGLNGFAVSNSFGNGKGLWHWSSGRASAEGHSRTHSIYYGKGESVAGGGNYNAGTNEGFFVSPPIDLRGSSLDAMLSFSYFMQVQTNELRDIATVEISTNAGVNYLPLSRAGGASDTNFVKDTKGKWQRAMLDLTPFVGNRILIRWHFNSVDSLLNATEGWYVDDIVVSLGSKPASAIQPTFSDEFVGGQWIGSVSIGGPIRTGKLIVEYDSDYISESGAFEILPFIDVNGNGLPDQWDNRFSFSSATEARAEADPDGDGASNGQEYLAGTNPLDPLSVLGISNHWIAGDIYHLAFPTVVGRFYDVESSSGFSFDEWQSVMAPFRGDGNSYEWTDPLRKDSPVRVYRLRLRP